jgi:hypothetical protein
MPPLHSARTAVQLCDPPRILEANDSKSKKLVLRWNMPKTHDEGDGKTDGFPHGKRAPHVPR